ncbi:hypothetical protein Tco_1343802 [Tanacetum coccineum]
MVAQLVIRFCYTNECSYFGGRCRRSRQAYSIYLLDIHLQQPNLLSTSYGANVKESGNRVDSSTATCDVGNGDKNRGYNWPTEEKTAERTKGYIFGLMGSCYVVIKWGVKGISTCVRLSYAVLAGEQVWVRGFGLDLDTVLRVPIATRKVREKVPTPRRLRTAHNDLNIISVRRHVWQSPENGRIFEKQQKD